MHLILVKGAMGEQHLLQSLAGDILHDQQVAAVLAEAVVDRPSLVRSKKRGVLLPQHAPLFSATQARGVTTAHQ